MRPQGLQQVRVTVMVNFMHQPQQTARLALGKAFAGKPSQVVAGQVSQSLAFVFAKGHGHGDELFQVLRVHLLAFMKARLWLE